VVPVGNIANRADFLFIALPFHHGEEILGNSPLGGKGYQVRGSGNAAAKNKKNRPQAGKFQTCPHLFFQKNRGTRNPYTPESKLFSYR
jgi:hypothetical protein